MGTYSTIAYNGWQNWLVTYGRHGIVVWCVQANEPFFLDFDIKPLDCEGPLRWHNGCCNRLVTLRSGVQYQPLSVFSHVFLVTAHSLKKLTLALPP